MASDPALPPDTEQPMSKRNKSKATDVVVLAPVELAPVVEAVEPPTFADLDLDIDAEVAADNAKSGSVVKSTYKHRYAERAATAGLGKVAQRSCWDWLAQQLAGGCLTRSKINIVKFLAVLDANGSITAAGRTGARAGRAGCG